MKGRVMAWIVLAGLAGVSRAGVDGAIEDEYVKMLVGKAVVAKVDVKVIRISKLVRADRAGGMNGTETLDQTKDATVVSPAGVTYRSEAHSREVLYAPKGTKLMVDKLSFGRSDIEIKVTAVGPDVRESTVITFDLDKKLDAGFSDRAAFDKMLGDTFEVVR